MLTLALVPVYRCLVSYNQFAFRITIFNIIVQFHCNMCTKSPVREIATIEGTSIHQKDGQTITTIWESGLFFFLSNSVQYETHLHYDTCFPPLLVIVISPWPIRDQIKNRQMSVCPSLPLSCSPSHVHACPKKNVSCQMVPCSWNEVCDALLSSRVLHIPLAEIGG